MTVKRPLFDVLNIRYVKRLEVEIEKLEDENAFLEAKVLNLLADFDVQSKNAAQCAKELQENKLLIKKVIDLLKANS